MCSRSTGELRDVRRVGCQPLGYDDEMRVGGDIGAVEVILISGGWRWEGDAGEPGADTVLLLLPPPGEPLSLVSLLLSNRRGLFHLSVIILVESEPSTTDEVCWNALALCINRTGIFP